MRKFLSRVIRRNLYLDLGNSSNMFGDHCYTPCEGLNYTILDKITPPVPKTPKKKLCKR